MCNNPALFINNNDVLTTLYKTRSINTVFDTKYLGIVIVDEV